MKTIKVLFSFFLFTLLITSCESDDPLASVKYQIVGFDSNITILKYNTPAGMINVADPDNFGNGTGVKTLSVNVLPFAPKLEVAAANPGANDKTYNLKIFVDGVQQANYDLTIAAGSSSAGSVEFVINP